MDLSDIQKNYPEISAAANDVLGLLSPRFTNKTGGHVETDISAATSLAGLSIPLRHFRYSISVYLNFNRVLTYFID
jgi:hypothetical protein